MAEKRRIIRRHEWGARYANGFGQRPVGNLITRLHHSVTIAPDLVPPFTDDYAAVRELERIGQSRFGAGISYNTIFTPAGLVFEGLGIDRVGAHTAGANTPTAGLVLVGNYEKDRPPTPMLEALTWYLELGAGEWWREAKLKGGHRDVASTACPGKYAYDLIDNINRGEFSGGGLVSNPIPSPSNPSVPSSLKVDGWWGSLVTRKMQKLLGTTVDGIVSSQEKAWADDNPGLTTGWHWVEEPRGSKMITAHQELLKKRGLYRGKIDGLVGEQYFTALQKDLGTTADGHVSEESRMVMALQRRLNNKKI